MTSKKLPKELLGFPVVEAENKDTTPQQVVLGDLNSYIVPITLNSYKNDTSEEQEPNCLIEVPAFVEIDGKQTAVTLRMWMYAENEDHARRLAAAWLAEVGGSDD